LSSNLQSVVTEIEVTTATLTARPFAGEADLPLIVELLNACEAVDQLDWHTSVDKLRTEYADPRLDPARDLQLWQDGDGELIGFGQIWILVSAEDLNGRIFTWIRPEARGGTLETEILDWGAERLREAMRAQSLPGRLRPTTSAEQTDEIALLSNLGFTIVRYSYTMERSLTEPIAEPQLPEGYMIREMVGPDEAEAWLEMFNLSFVDHPNHSPWKVEQVLHYLDEPIYRPDLNLVAVASDGTLAGFCWMLINPEDNAHTGRLVGEIDVLGTRRGYRKLGLGRALLLEGIRRLRQAGMATARLDVVANNPTGARQLYESAGFRTQRTWILFSKDV
jgi:mycothiol synthase